MFGRRQLSPLITPRLPDTSRFPCMTPHLVARPATKGRRREFFRRKWRISFRPVLKGLVDANYSAPPDQVAGDEAGHKGAGEITIRAIFSAMVTPSIAAPTVRVRAEHGPRPPKPTDEKGVLLQGSTPTANRFGDKDIHGGSQAGAGTQRDTRGQSATTPVPLRTSGAPHPMCDRCGWRPATDSAELARRRRPASQCGAR